MSFWEFLSKEPVWFKGIIIACLMFIIWLIIRKDIKSKWFSFKKHERRKSIEVRKGPDRRKPRGKKRST